jgi:hypothetical protein
MGVPGIALGTSFSGEAPLRPAPLVVARTIDSTKTARRRERRRVHRLSVPRANTSARQITTDFTFLIGIAHAVALEAIVFMALWLVWYGVSSLNAEAFL